MFDGIIYKLLFKHCFATILIIDIHCEESETSNAMKDSGQKIC